MSLNIIFSVFLAFILVSERHRVAGDELSNAKATEPCAERLSFYDTSNQPEPLAKLGPSTVSPTKSYEIVIRPTPVEPSEEHNLNSETERQSSTKKPHLLLPHKTKVSLPGKDNPIQEAINDKIDPDFEVSNSHQHFLLHNHSTLERDSLTTDTNTPTHNLDLDTNPAIAAHKHHLELVKLYQDLLKKDEGKPYKKQKVDTSKTCIVDTPVETPEDFETHSRRSMSSAPEEELLENFDDADRSGNSQEPANIGLNSLEDPTKRGGVRPLSQAVMIKGTTVCYACSSLSDPSCWLPNRSTTGKYCSPGHNSCVTKTFRATPKSQLIVIRDCGNTCKESHPGYKSCTICKESLCNNQPVEVNSAFATNPFNVICVLFVTGLISFLA